MKVDSITFETIGGATRDDIRIKRYEFLKTAENLHNLPRKSGQPAVPKLLSKSPARNPTSRTRNSTKLSRFIWYMNGLIFMQKHLSYDTPKGYFTNETGYAK